jgi:hypothetical protein
MANLAWSKNECLLSSGAHGFLVALHLQDVKVEQANKRSQKWGEADMMEKCMIYFEYRKFLVNPIAIFFPGSPNIWSHADPAARRSMATSVQVVARLLLLVLLVAVLVATRVLH